MLFSVCTVSTPEWTPAEAVAELADAGYDGVEWRIVDQDPSPDGEPGFWAGNRCTWPFAGLLDDVAAIRRTTASVGLSMPVLSTYVACDQPDHVDLAMRAAVALGVGQVRVTVPRYQPSERFAAVWERRRAEYADVARLAARHGVRALVEIHHTTPVLSPHAAAAFVDGLDPRHVGVIHDAGNMVYEGWAPYRLGLEVLGDHLAHVHLKNARWVRAGARPDGSADWRPEMSPLRDGVVDVPALFTALRQVGYDGWVSLEDFSTEQPLAARVRDNLTYATSAATSSRAM